MGARGELYMVEKAKKVEKWKTIKIPESLWRTIKVEAAKKGLNIYKEIGLRYGN